MRKSRRTMAASLRNDVLLTACRSRHEVGDRGLDFLEPADWKSLLHEPRKDFHRAVGGGCQVELENDPLFGIELRNSADAQVARRERLLNAAPDRAHPHAIALLRELVRQL